MSDTMRAREISSSLYARGGDGTMGAAMRTDIRAESVVKIVRTVRSSSSSAHRKP